MNIPEKLDSVLSRLDVLERLIKESMTETVELETLNHWTDNQDELKLGGFLIHANYSTWKQVKEYFVESKNLNEGQFYIEIEDVYTDISYGNGMTIEQAKQLRDYLSEKIDYLEDIKDKNKSLEVDLNDLF